MVVGLLGNKSPDSNRFTLVTPKPENGVRLQATLGNQNPTGLPVGAVSSENRMTVVLHSAAVLYLRSGRGTPEKMEIELVTSGGTVVFDISVMKMTDYDLDSIFGRKLYFLIPFYLFNREKDFKECEDDDERLAGLLGEVSRLVSRLDAAG